MFKRIISIILIIVTLLTSIVSLGGCSPKSNNSLTIGQWLGMLNTAFGMESYAQEEPYLKSISKDNPYFNTIQIAAEWDVIDKNENINPNEALRWEEALVTLVNVGNFTSHDASNEDKVDYAIKNFDNTIRKYWMNRTIDVSTATNLLVKAQEQWANKTYSEQISKIEYLDNIKTISNNDSNIISNSNSTIILHEDNAKDYKSGDIVVIEKNGECGTPKAYKVQEVKISDGQAELLLNDDVELGDFVDELYIQDTFTPDLTQAEIYDGNGNLVNLGSNYAVVPQSKTSNNTPAITTLAYNSKDAKVTPLAAAKTTFEFETDSCKVEVTIKSDGLSAKIEVPMEEFGKGVKGYYEAEVSNFKVTNKIDYSWFTLHSAEVKVDYQTKSTIGVKKTFKKESAVYAPKWTNGNGKFLSNLKNSVWKNAKKPGAKTIKIGSIKVASVGVASFSVDVYAKLKVDGSIEISCSETGCKGIEYKNGTCRVINTSDKDTDLKFKCKAEGTVSVAPTVNAFGFAIIGLSAEVGLGAEASLTIHLADAGNHLIQETEFADIPPEVVEELEVNGLTADAEEVKKLAEAQGGKFESETSTIDLHLDSCIDINIYFILRVGIEEETLAGKLLKGTKIKVTWELCGSKNAKLCNLHVENFDFITAFKNIGFFTDKNQCTLKYKPFDDVKEKTEETKDEETNSKGINVGEVLVISDMKIVIQTGTCKTISVIQVPKGYELKDVICESADSKIASIDKNGVITAKEEGSTTIIVKTKDGKYSCACAVTVTSENTKDFTPLKYYTYNATEGVYAA